MKRFLLNAFCLVLLTISVNSFAQFNTATVNGTIAASEYGTHTDGNNQQTSGAAITYMTWDATNLYVGVAAANTAEAFVIYFDKDNLTPIDSGTNTNGTLVGNAYDGTNFAGLPFRADIVMYVKNGYREFRTADGANGWSAATASFGTYAETGGNVREFSIPWASFPGAAKPAAFNWVSYVTSSGGFVYGQVPTANAGGTIGTAARYERYYSVLNTATGTSTKPMSRDCFVFNNTADENTFGAISVADFTMNSTGRQIARVAGNWTISGTLRVNAGSIYYGSGGSYGTSAVGNAVVSGGLLDMDANNQLQAFASSVTVSGGTFNMGNAANNVTIASGISTVATALTISGTGTVNISNGTLAIGVTGGGNQALNLSGGTLNLTNAGTINLNGNFTRPTAGGQFNQSGTNSLLSIDGNSGTAASSITTGVPSFNVISATGTGLNCTAGTIRIIDPHHSSIAVSGPKAVSISYSTTAPTAYQFSGSHTFEFGNGSSTTGGNADGFVVDNYVSTYRIPLQNILVNSGATANRWVSSAYTAGNGTSLNGNLTINTGCEFRNTTALTTTPFTIAGNIINAGTLTSTQIIQFALNPIAGSAPVANTAAQTISGAGTFRNLTASPTANFASITTNNSSAGGITFANPSSISGAFVNNAGLIFLGNNDFTFIVGSTSFTGSATQMFVTSAGTTGALKYVFPIGAASGVFPVGENTGTTEFSPYTIAFSANSAIRTIGVRVVNANHPNLNSGDVQTDYISRYWQISNSAAGTYTYGGSATYLPADIIGTQTNMRPNLWTGALPWVQLTGSAATNVLTFVDGATETTAPLGTTAEFTGRLKSPLTYTWNQTGSAAYGTAANWTPTRTSPASDDILIFNGSLTPTPTVTGFATQTIGKLLFINNANVNLQATATATLTISGGAGTDLDIPSGSTLNLSGTQNIGIAFTGTTTAAIAGTLKTSTTGTGTLVFTNSTTTVTGTLDLSSVINANTSTATNLLFSSGGTCIIGSNSPAVPLAGWNANSNLNFTGNTTNTGAPTNSVQNFGNILFDCSGNTATLNMFVSNTLNIQGNVEIRNTGSGKFRFGSAPTINIAGNLSVTNTANCDIANGAGSVNVTGNFIMSSTGTVDLAPSSSNATLKVAGTFNQTAGTITESSTSTGSAIEFNGTVSQSVTTGTVSNTVNYRVNNAAGITLPAILNINASAGLRISNGTITSGTVAYNAVGTTLTYDSSTGTQTSTNIEFPTTNGPVNLTLNNTNATPNVSLHASRSISGVLTLTAGRLVLGANDFTLGVASTVSGTPSATKMVVTDGAGQLKKVFAIGASAFTFPVGETTGVTEYSPNTLTFTANDTQRTIGVKVIDGTHPNINTGTTPVDYLSRYWSFTDNQAGSYTYTGSFTYVTGGVDVNGTEANIKVGRWNGSAWTQQTSTIASPVLTISAALTETTGLLNGNDFTGRSTPNIIYTWTGATSTDWATNGNWDIAGFPNSASHQVVINTAGGNQPTIASGASYTTNTITINNAAATLTLNGTASLTTSGLATITAGTVTLNGTSTLTTAGGLSNAGTIAVGTGYLNLQTSFANTGTITSACTGTIEFGIAGGTIPQNITYGNLTVSGAGSFVFSAAGVVTVCGTYSQPGATTASTIVTLANSALVNTMTVGGNFNVSAGNATFPSTFRFINSGSALSNATVAVTGNVTISGSGRINLEATTATSSVAIMTVAGNFTSTGTTVASTGANGVIDFGSGTVAGNTINIAGNFDKSGAGNFGTASGSIATGFVFNKSGTQTFSYTGLDSDYVNITVASTSTLKMLSGFVISAASAPVSIFTVNGTLDTSTFTINGGATNGSFILASGATLKTANTNGVVSTTVGSVSTSIATRTFNSAANYEFNGTLAQTANMPNVIMNNLTINNTAGVSLTQSITANGILDFQNGLLNSPTATPITIGASGSVTNASATKYVNGKLNRIYSAIGSKIFPVGKGGVYRPVTFEYTALTGTSTVSTEQIETALTGSLPASTNLNNARTWDISQTGGSAFTYKVTLDGTGDSVTGVVAMLKKESGTITSNAATTPNYTNTTGFTTLVGTNNFTLGSTCTQTAVAGSNQTICLGSTATLAATAPTYGSGAWSVTGPSTLTSQFSSVSSPTAVFTPAGGAGVYTLTWTLTNGNCSNPASITITVNPTSVAGSITGAGSVCTGTNSTTLTLGGNTGTIQWQSSTDNSTFNDISGQIASTLTVTNLTATTYYRAVVTSGVCAAATTTSVTVTVNPVSVAGSITGGGVSVCSGTNSTTLTLGGYTGSIQWQSSTDDSTFTTISGQTATTYIATNIAATTYYRALVTSGACTAATTASVSISTKINVAITSVTSSANPICASATATLTANGVVGTNAVLTWWTGTNGTGTNLGNTATITVGPGTYYARVTGDCGAPQEANFIINAIAVPTYANLQYPGSGAICLGGSYDTYGQVYQAGITPGAGAGSGITAEFGYNATDTDPSTWTNWLATTYNVDSGNNDEYKNTFIPVTSGTYYYTYRYRQGTCDWIYGGYSGTGGGFWNGTTNVNGVLTVNPNPTASVAAPNATICFNTDATFTLTGTSGAVVTYNINGASNTTATLTGGTATVTVANATATQTLNLVSVTIGSCTTSLSGSAVVSQGLATTWSAGAWDNGTPASSTTTAIISSDYTTGVGLATGFTACSLIINTGAVVLVSSGDNITLNGGLTIQSGSFTLDNDANLIQNTTVTNTDNISVNRTTAALMRQDYALWSSPVAGQQLQAFSPMTLATRFYTYSPSGNIYVATSPTANFAASTGYLIRVPNNHPVTALSWTGTFTGVPNNGDQGLTNITSGLFYATGNPYPSAINANAFITSNSITEPLYFWRKTNNTNTSSYATYTTMGGVSNSPADPLALTPNGYIQVGQGFIAKAANTSLNFTNTMRVSNSGPFLRTSDNRSRIWLDLNGANGAFGQILVGYMPGATSGIDGAIDGRFFGDSQTALTSTINNEDFIIQGRAFPFETTDVVALGFKSELAGSYTISINHVDGLFETTNQNIYLKDNLTNTTTDLRAGSYTFATEAGVFNNRFEIVYAAPLAVNQNTFDANAVVVYHQNNQLVINTGKVTMANVAVYDISGRLIASKNNIKATETKINVGTTQQVLLVKITSIENGTVTKKVIN